MSRRCQILAVILLSIFIPIGCAQSKKPTIRELPTQTPDLTDPNLSASNPSIRDVRRRVLAPWDGLVRMVSPELLQAEQLEDSGKLREALDAYTAVETSSSIAEVRDAAFLLRAGLMLKLGRSQEVLNEISRNVKARGLAADEIDPLRAILASFSYTQQKNHDQALAWISVAIRRSGGMPEIGSAAKSEAYRLVRVISSDSFDAVALKWSSEPLIAPIFAEERAHRERGSKPEPDISARWFLPETYGIPPTGIGDLDGLPPAQGLGDSDLAGLVQSPYVPQPGEVVIGVLLPLSGKFKEHGEKIKRGIELAVLRYGGGIPIHLEFGDTAGEPDLASQEYERLVHSSASVVIGPLLLKTTESVAQKSKALKVPFISFTKKKGIPRLGENVFRLGATVEDQVHELVEYARGVRKLETFSILTPDTESGEEFASEFDAAIKKSGGRVFRKIVYRRGDPAALESSLQLILADSPQAIFAPESLAETGPALSRVRVSSPQMVLLGSALWDDLAALRTFSATLDGALFVSPFYVSSDNPSVVEFAQQYREKYGVEPEVLAAQGYDAVRLVLNTLSSQPASNNAAQANTPRILANKLASAGTFTGATGRISVLNRDFVRRMSVLGIRNGSVIELATGGEIRDQGFTYNAEETKETSFDFRR